MRGTRRPFCSTAAVDLSAARVAGASAILEGERPRLVLGDGLRRGEGTEALPLQHLPTRLRPPPQRAMPLSLCSGGTAARSFKVMAPEAVQKGLRALYTFDDALGYDSAAHQDGRVQARFAEPGNKGARLQFAPGHGGVGSSLKFDGGKGDYVRLPAVSDTESELTVAFWLFLRNSPISTYNFLVRKGDESVQFTPTIQISKTRQLHVRLREINDPNLHGHSFESFARVPWEKWTHISLVLQGQVAQIYVNGVRTTSSS